VRTPFDATNAGFSGKAHLAAREQFYPRLFNTSPGSLKFVDTVMDGTERNRILDGEMAVDRMVYVTKTDLHHPLTFTIQERFRRPQYKRYQDLTITEHNGCSGMPSELYKLTCGIFVYGYYSEQNDKILQALAINTSGLMYSFAVGDLTPDSKKINCKEQTFLSFLFDQLYRKGLVLFSYTSPQGAR